MHLKRAATYGVALVFALLGSLILPQTSGYAHDGAEQITCNEANLQCLTTKFNTGGNLLVEISAPQLPAIVVATAPKPVTKTVTYVVETRGTIIADLAEFKQQANATLNDSRGWARMGVKFEEVASGGQFTLFLSEASQMTSFSASVCDNIYSCQLGRNVIINQDRWLYATKAWNDGGGSLRDYRHMVVNHETGHWLGHGHQTCKKAGTPAAVMQQQSISLQGCTFNPWPLDSELWSTKLGI